MPSHDEMARWRREVRQHEERRLAQMSRLDSCASALLDCHSSLPAGLSWKQAGEITREDFRRQAQAVLDAFNAREEAP